MIKLPYRCWDFLAIGGVGMSAVAKVLTHFGAMVTGTDLHEGEEVFRLRQAGIAVRKGHSGKLPDGVEAVVYSSAIPADNPELWTARARGLRIFHRAEVLADLMQQTTSLGVTGSHGKTTTSALISHILHDQGRQPTCLVGGEIRNVGDNVIRGSDELIVAEIDESDQTQELSRPDVAVITNIEPDHLDHYGSLGGLEASFTRFIDGLGRRRLVYNGQDNLTAQIVGEVKPPHAFRFGLSPEFDCAGLAVCYKGFGSTFDLVFNGRRVGRAHLNVPGAHNVANALAAVAAVSQVGVSPASAMGALESFKGTRRRLEVLFEQNDRMVIDDYAHHPTEIEVSIRAVRALGRPLSVIFQPHRFSRTKIMAPMFANCFKGADRVFLTDIYAADEKPLSRVSTSLILDAVRSGSHPDVTYLPREEILNYLDAHPIPGEAVAFLGAGDIGEIAHAYGKHQAEVLV